MDVIGTCINCFPATGSFLINSGIALAVLGFAISRSMAGRASDTGVGSL